MDAELTFHPGSNSREFGLVLRAGANGAGVRISYEFATAQMCVDRSNAGDASFSALFPSVYCAPLSGDRHGKISMRILLDWSSVEVFGGKGESVITAQVFPSDSNLGVSVYSLGGADRVGLTLHSPESIWGS